MLERYPDGAAGKSFFQKRVPEHHPDWLETTVVATPNGAAIPIEERDPDEVLACGGQRLGPAGVGARNPVFDVTPAELVDAIVTERGIVEQPTEERMRALLRVAKR